MRRTNFQADVACSLGLYYKLLDALIAGLILEVVVSEISETREGDSNFLCAPIRSAIASSVDTHREGVPEQRKGPKMNI